MYRSAVVPIAVCPGCRDLTAWVRTLVVRRIRFDRFMSGRSACRKQRSEVKVLQHSRVMLSAEISGSCDEEKAVVEDGTLGDLFCVLVWIRERGLLLEKDSSNTRREPDNPGQRPFSRGG